MNRIIDFNIEDIDPDSRDVLLHQGVPKGIEAPEKIRILLNEAVDIFKQTVQPEGIITELPLQQFEKIFSGEGNNFDDVILAEIYPEADNLALFVLTMGAEVSTRIERMFNEGDFALGSMLDAVASLAADKAVDIFEKFYYDHLDNERKLKRDAAVLGYSPGYCGWHISGQKKLFEFLKPEQIGVTLNGSFLMTPLKSVSGVLVEGSKDIHLFENTFDYCGDCKNESCIDRMNKIQSI